MTIHSHFMHTLLKSTLIALTLSCITIIGCAPKGEPASTVDATPPPDYHPVFARQTAPYASRPANAPAPIVQVTRVETRDPRKVRVVVHILDSNGTILTGASAAKYKKLWCGVSEDLDGNITEIKSYTLTELTDADRQPNAIALVLDHSGSMGTTRAVTVQNAIADLINDKKDEDAFAIVKYDDKTVVEVPLTTNKSTLTSQFVKDGLNGYGGGTAINDGIATGIAQLATATGYKRKVLVVFTDGLDNSSKINKDSLFALARANDITLCTVAFGNSVNQNLLMDYAANTGGSYHHIYGTNEFSLLFDDVYQRLRNSYVIEYTPVDYGVHTIRIKLCTGKDSAVASAQFDNTPNIGSINLLNVFFDYNKADVKPESKRAIDNVVTMMRTFPKMTIEVRGHTDNINNTKDVDFNKKLSQKRADNVRTQLIRMGIEGERITATGYGDSQPVADNIDEAGRAQNRRTEFLILSR